MREPNSWIEGNHDEANSNSKTAPHGRRSFFKQAAGALTADSGRRNAEALPQNTNTNSNRAI
jgi:hypothetical protein